MKTKSRNFLITILLAFAFVCGMFAITPLTAFAQGEETTPVIVSVGDNLVDQETNMGGAPTVIMGQPYSAQVNATGGNLTFSAGAGEYSKLPNGLTINAETGVISGTCTELEMGRHNVYITAKNSFGEAHAVIGMWVVDNSIAPVIQTDSGSLGTIYANSFSQFTVSVQSNANYLHDIEWTLSNGTLPNGMELQYVNTSTVYINGTPTQTGTFDFTLKVENEIGTAERAFSITVQEGVVTPTIIDDYSTIPYAIVGKPYEYQLKATGTNTQSNPIIWSFNDDEFSQNSYDLGKGLTLSNTGVISGTPTEYGQVDLTSIYAKNSAGQASTAPYLMVYENGAVTEIVVSPEETVVQKGGSKQFTAQVFGYGDVSQEITSWDTSMYVPELSGWFPRPTSSDTKIVNGVLTVGEDEERSQIMVVAIVGNEKGYAMVTIAEKADVIYQVAFDKNGGDGTMNSVPVIENNTYTLPNCTFTAPTGYEFKCWSVNEVEKAVGEQITITANTTVKAIWKELPIPQSLTATYTGEILAGTTINPSGISIILTYSDSSTEPVNAGNVEYWYNGSQIQDPINYVFGVELIGNLNITVKYQGFETTMAVQVVGYEITFNANNGTGDMQPVEYVGEYTLPNCTFTAPNGKQFKGWATTANGEVINGTTYNVTADVELFAIWEDIPVVKFDITFNANGGTGTMQGVEFAGTYTLPTCAFTAPDGKQFKGWATSANGEVIDGTTYNVTANVELFAIWEDIPVVNFNVTFNANGGTGTMSPVEYAGTYTLPTCAFTAPDGKQFKGWATSANGEVIDGATYNVTANVELFAIWEDIPHNHDYGTTWESDANNHWNECSCGDKANVGAHSDGNADGKCDTCDYQMANGGGAPETPDNPKDGLSGGAIAGIVVGSVVVLGLGGFALVWFVIKKKSFADLVAIFKKK